MKERKSYLKSLAYREYFPFKICQTVRANVKEIRNFSMATGEVLLLLANCQSPLTWRRKPVKKLLLENYWKNWGIQKISDQGKGVREKALGKKKKSSDCYLLFAFYSSVSLRVAWWIDWLLEMLRKCQQRCNTSGSSRFWEEYKHCISFWWNLK